MPERPSLDTGIYIKNAIDNNPIYPEHSFMFKIVFYKDSRGREPVREAILDIANSGGKNARVNALKIAEYLKILEHAGTRAGAPYVKHLSGEIWELRPLRNRILFFAFTGTEFVLLHHFIKKTQKTPANEIEQAKRNMNDFKERNKI